MAMTRLIRASGKAARMLTILLSVLMLSTCGFLTDDVFPRWLSYVEASIDFRSILIDQGLGADADVENLELASYVIGTDDYSKELVYVSGNGAASLILLDPSDLSFKHARLDDPLLNFNRNLASVTKGFLCGNDVIDPTSATYPIHGNFITGWNNPSTVRMFRVGDPITGFNYAVDEYGTSMGADFRQYDDTWLITVNIASRTWDSAFQMYHLLDSENVNGYSVLAQRNDYGTAYAASYPLFFDFTDNAAMSVFDWGGTTTVTGPFPVSESYAWLTEGGPVAFHRGDNGNDRLIRYAWGTGDFALGTQSTEIDSMAFDNDEDIRLLSFDPSGTWWFLYDRMDGKLYKLRTWWK